MMNRFDRIVATLLLLRSGRSVSATDLAARFEISPRTVYRDIDTLSSLGVPVSVEEGRDGGFRLLDGFFLPPLMFSREEAISLLLGLALLHNLRAKPFPTELETAQQKLLAAVPEPLQDILARADRIMGFESLPDDVFHPEPTSGQPALTPAATALIGKIGRLF
ncbi:MAG TPA: HTH domain-containing protein, partial [Anaerolineae bacterium]